MANGVCGVTAQGLGEMPEPQGNTGGWLLLKMLITWSSLVAQRVKDPALSLLWCWLLPWWGFRFLAWELGRAESVAKKINKMLITQPYLISRNSELINLCGFFFLSFPRDCNGSQD